MSPSLLLFQKRLIILAILLESGIAVALLENGQPSLSVLESSAKAAIVPYVIEMDQRCAFAAAAVGGWVAADAAVTGKVMRIVPAVGYDTLAFVLLVPEEYPSSLSSRRDAATR